MKKWTDKDIVLIKKYYPIEGMTCAKRLNRSPMSVKSKAFKMGIKHKRGYKWTKKEVEILKKYYKSEGQKCLRRIRGSSPSESAIAVMVKKIGLSCNRSLFCGGPRRGLKGTDNPMYGKRHSLDAKRKMSDSKRGRYVGKSNPFWGKRHTRETKEKISFALIENEICMGKNNPNWRGGISKEPYSQDWTLTLKKSIRQRDNYICQICGIHQDDIKSKLSVHHIDYDKENCNPNNLISLCRSCHGKTHTDRNYWPSFLRSLMSPINEEM